MILFYTSFLGDVKPLIRFEIFSIIKEVPIKTIPITETESGDSSGRIIQLRAAPETGIRNFQMMSSETLTDGRRSKVFHIEMASAY